ncbi:cation transporter [Alkalicaulis satelles]|uniref:Cation transporter n=1 Tax=Alkalicaulis satelles TaxID=2609175 RepID=A0A5M6ZHN6_9PROT|nr:cation diffusion facilitator family transporter [Alkalicaulis satelles]KAA5803810.1 cation transporter [Alkalicaulis satelles]
MAHDAAPGGPGKLSPLEARAITTRITRLSVLTACALVILKLIAFLLSGSVAMLASLADSALDLAASLITFFAVRYAASPADAAHRFGHGKAEALAGLFQAVLVAFSAALLLREAGLRFLDPQPVAAGGVAVSVMVISIIATVLLVRAQTRAIARTGSLAVSGDRAHYLSDLGANLAVIAAIVLAMTGVERADPLIAAGVAFWLVWTALSIARKAIENLMDRELPDAARAEIRTLAGDDRRVRGITQLRTRASGPFIHVQMHMQLEDSLSLAEAHDVLSAAEARIAAAWPAADVIIHPEPESAGAFHGHPWFKGAADREAGDKAGRADRPGAER